MDDVISDESFPMPYPVVEEITGFNHGELAFLVRMGFLSLNVNGTLFYLAKYDRSTFDTMLCRYLRHFNEFIRERHPSVYDEFASWFDDFQHPKEEIGDELTQWQQRVKVFLKWCEGIRPQLEQPFDILHWLDSELVQYEEHRDEFRAFLNWRKKSRGNVEPRIASEDVYTFYEELLTWRYMQRFESQGGQEEINYFEI